MTSGPEPVPHARLRSTIAVLGVLGLALLVNGGRGVLQVAAVASDGVGEQFMVEYQERFAAVRAVLPRRGTVGYIGSPQPHEATGARGGTYALVLVQHALAPLRIDRDYKRYDLVIGNYHGGIPPPEARPRGYELTRDFGDGVVLYERIAP